MDAKTVLKELEKMGSEQTRKTYRRHGVGDNQFGVSYANLGKLTKQIKRDHNLALQLWESGNHDARVLATMIGDPAQANDKLLEAWVKELENFTLTGAFSGFASQAPSASKKMAKWTKSKSEMIGGAGWLMLAHLARINNELPDEFFEPYLEIIGKEIHARKNRVRDAMNSALIAIGIRNDNLRKKALATAKKVGKVEVDHGDTNCKTPAAAEYIQKAVQRRKK